jgi:hypothetical protein
MKKLFKIYGEIKNLKDIKKDNFKKFLIPGLFILHGIILLSLVCRDANLEKEISILRVEKADKKEVNGMQVMLDVLTGVKESNDKPPAEFIIK